MKNSIPNKLTNQFVLFPPIDVKFLPNKGKTMKFLSCNLQKASVETNSNLSINVNKHKNLKELLLKPTLINIKDEINFYTGLKQYYKINIKKDILSKFFLENQKKLITINKQNNERTAFLSGDLIFPVKDNYNFIKRRFVLNLRKKSVSIRRRRRRNRMVFSNSAITNQFVVKRFIKIIRKLNVKTILSSINNLKNSKKLPVKKLHLYLKYVPPTYAGRNYVILGLQGFFHHYKQFYFKSKYYGFVPKSYLFNTTLHTKILQFFYFFKNYRNRLFFLKKIMLTFFRNQKLNLKSIKNNNSMLLKQLAFSLIKEFISIKLFLQRFLIFRITSLNRKKKRIILKKLKKRLKFSLLLFKKVKLIYNNVFLFLFNNSDFNFEKVFDFTFALNKLSLLKLNPTGLKFKKFNNGLLTNSRRFFIKKKMRYKGKKPKRLLNYLKFKYKKKVISRMKFTKKYVAYNSQKMVELKALFDTKALYEIKLPFYRKTTRLKLRKPAIKFLLNIKKSSKFLSHQDYLRNVNLLSRNVFKHSKNIQKHSKNQINTKLAVSKLNVYKDKGKHKDKSKYKYKDKGKHNVKINKNKI